MNPWVIYGLAISLSCGASVLIMGRSQRRLHRACVMMQHTVTVTVFAASEMWDTLTPDQIRTLHPTTVEVGNRVPPWSEIEATRPYP